jgi:hypothetical protein
VVLQDNTVFIRGGRQDEVGFYLEGVPITNKFAGGRAVTLVQDAIEEIQVQAGGYNAEFGGANSGIIQTQLKSGTSDWKASAQYSSDNIGFKSLKSSSRARRRSVPTVRLQRIHRTLSGPLLSTSSLSGSSTTDSTGPDPSHTPASTRKYDPVTET